MREKKSSRLKQVHCPPIPTRVIFNEEFVPPPQTFKQAQVEWLIDQASETLSSHFLAEFSRPLEKITSFGERTPSVTGPCKAKSQPSYDSRFLMNYKKDMDILF